MALRNPAVFKNRLSKIDDAYVFRRIYLMGCARSGTWLLTALFSTFSDLDVIPKELGFEHFGIFVTKKKAMVIKRDFIAHQRIEHIPDCIEIVYIIRHPFDVLTSHNPTTTDRVFHVAPHRWLGEMLSLQYILDTKRNNTTIIRYEDLVREPSNTQCLIAETLKLGISHPVEVLDKVFRAPADALSAMHGLRPIDTNSIDKYKNDPDKMNYLRSIVPRDWANPQLGWRRIWIRCFGSVFLNLQVMTGSLRGEGIQFIGRMTMTLAALIPAAASP